MKPWHKIASKTEWDKTCAAACAAARVEVPAALKALRAANAVPAPRKKKAKK